MALLEDIQPASTKTLSNVPAFNKLKEEIVTFAPDVSGEQSTCFQIVDEEGIQVLSFPVKDNEMEIAIRRADLGLRLGQPLRLQFKWEDNIQRDGDIMEFTLSGDAAPNRRFNYLYETK